MDFGDMASLSAMGLTSEYQLVWRKKQTEVRRTVKQQVRQKIRECVSNEVRLEAGVEGKWGF